MEKNEHTMATYGVQGYHAFQPKFRRRRKSTGDDQFEALAPSSAIDELEAGKRGDSVYCKECGHFYPWRKMIARYEKRGTDWFLMWFHERCGNMVQERNLEDHG